MKRIVVALLVALVAACVVPFDPGPSPSPDPPSPSPDPPSPSPDPPNACDRTFVVSPAFPDPEKLALEHAVERWNVIAIERFCLTDGDGEKSEHGIFRIAYRSPYWYELSKSFGGADVLGVHWGGSDQIGIVDVLSPELFELVALHELGHAHGLGHTAAPAIMHAGVGTANDFTPIDIAECQRVEACPSDAGAPTVFLGGRPFLQAVFR
jgi:hypothetical protein